MSIGSTIKKLRRERDMTQEQLAEFLGITANAVSQWECDRTAPDISQLPILANIFDVSTDHLLEVDTTKRNEIIKNIRHKSWELCNSGDKSGAAGLIREGLTKFPNNFNMMLDMIVFLYQQAFHQECTPQDHCSLCIEAADYIDSILDGCNDIRIKAEAIQLACSIFPVINRYDDALKLTDMIPDISKEELLTALYNGNELTEHIKSCICKSLTFAADQIIWLASVKNTNGSFLYGDDKKLLLYQKALSIYDTLYENGDYYFDAEALSQAQMSIADIWIKKQNTEKTLYHLEKSIDHIIMFDTYDENTDHHTSLLLSEKASVGVNRNSTDNGCHRILCKLKNDKSYDLIENDPKYSDLIKRLEQIDNK